MISMAVDYPLSSGRAQRIVLVSSSPRRADLLRLLVDEFEVRAPQEIEGEVGRPWDLLVIAERKFLSVEKGPDEILVAADTGVFHRGVHLGKPRDLGEAREMLSRLSGDWHRVYTGLVVMGGGAVVRELVSTRVKFREISPEEIDWYLSREDVLDKAGAYAIQGAASAFVEEIQGDFTNVVGLPLGALYRALVRCGWIPVVGRGSGG